MPMEPSLMQEKKSGFPAAFLAGGAIVLLLLGLLFLLLRERGAAPGAPPPLPMTAVEQAYAANIHFSDIQMSRAANFLNQEVTYVDCTVANDGPRPIKRMEVTLEFRDPFGQVVLRETRRIPPPIEAPYAPGEHRDVRFTFESIPVQWNHAYPELRVTGLLLG
jgi:hypothetical protein